jgi:hypothetical protein
MATPNSPKQSPADIAASEESKPSNSRVSEEPKKAPRIDDAARDDEVRGAEIGEVEIMEANEAHANLYKELRTGFVVEKK